MIVAVFAMIYAYLNTNNLLPWNKLPLEKKSFSTGFNELKSVIGSNYDSFVSRSAHLNNAELDDLNSKLSAFKAGISTDSYQNPTTLINLADIFQELVKVHSQKNAINKIIEQEKEFTSKEEKASLNLLVSELDKIKNWLIEILRKIEGPSGNITWEKFLEQEKII